MTIRRRAVTGLLALNAAVAIFFGVRYGVTSAAMPYHLLFLGGEVTPRVASLLLLQYKVFAGTFIAAGVVTALLAGPVASGDRRSWWAVMALGVILGAPVAWVTWQVGHGAPVWAPILNLIVVGSALALARVRV